VPFICYEIIFPGLVDHAVAGADMMINITNDAWFGDTPGPYQHFSQAQLRAVETGLPLLRAANNGISAVVDGYGRVIDALGMNAVGVIDASVPIGRTGRLSFGTPAFNGLVILIGFGLWASFLRWRSRFRAN
jgi:apolipoprotein N-acyltransferase